MNLFRPNTPVSGFCPSEAMDTRKAKQWAISMLMALLPLSSIAQNQSENPADPAQPAAALRYESAFKNYQAAAESGEPSDKVWRAANEQVARLRGHAGHLRAAEPGETTSPSSSPAPKSAPTSTPFGHAIHHGHGGQ